MRKYFILVNLIFFSNLTVFANTPDSVKVDKSKIEFSGFFRADYWYDSHQIVDAVDGLFLLYPKRSEIDAKGKDIQAAPDINFLAMGTRLRTKILMPDLFKAKSMIMIEGDFTGMSTIVNLRIRQAYTKLQWEKSSLLFGLTWHPMFASDVYPSVASLNTGAPFQSFNRSPQLTFQKKLWKGTTISLSAVHQSDSRSLGPISSPNDASTTYLRNSLLPNLNANLQLIMGAFTIGGSIDYKSLRPRLFTTSLSTPGLKYSTSERINSYSGMLYIKFQRTKLIVKTKGMLGQNLTEHLLPGGYAVSSLDSISGKETYTPTNHLFLFANITYGKEFQVGLFLGYAKNFGTNNNFIKDRYFSRAMDIDYIYRCSPSISYAIDRFQISTELEYTAAAFGDINNLDKGKILNSKITYNYRPLIVVQYTF